MRVVVKALLALVLGVGVTTLGPGGTPSYAAGSYCKGRGVNVVVDFGELGGGIRRGCDPSGANRPASSVFPRAGFPLTPVQRQPGFVCRVSGKPASDPCVNTPPPDAYWSLWKSDGKSGRWTYASTGAGSLKVPNGGFVAFSWQGSQSRRPPGTAPVNRQSTQPTPQPSPDPTPRPTPKPTPKPSPRPTPKATAQPTQQETQQPSANPGPSAPGDAGAPAGPGTGPGNGPQDTPSPRRTQSGRAEGQAGGPASRGPRRGGQAPESKQKQKQTSPSGGGVAPSNPRSNPLSNPPSDTGDGGAPAAEPGQSVSSGESGALSPLPVWVPIGALGLLAVATAVTAATRRRRHGLT